MSKLVHNEQTKLFATFMNNLAVASVVTGVLTPAFANHFQLSPLGQFIFVLGGVLMGYVVHRFARLFLRDLQE
jgi:hypothetical protein